MSLSPQFLDELRSRTSLSALIGKAVRLQKAGREYKGCCPFHDEKTPSFYVNDEKGFYHCFGCGAHGDAIRWMTDQGGLPFMDAIKELAAAAGMEVPAPDPRMAKRAEKARSLHEVVAAAQDWFVAQLEGIEGVEARAYLERRGITEQTRRAFGLGFAPDGRGRLKAALKEFPEEMLIEVGMLIQPEDGARESYDRFRSRLMIPIRDQRGRVIAFGGRILGQGEPKYLNSPETPLFDKGRTLFNLDKAAPAARKSGRLIVVEGYMDAIMIAQSGIAEAVAPLGTALTEHQMERLWTMVETPILCFDGDGAGQRAALRAAHRALPLLRPGNSLSFALMRAGQDPDDLIRASGAEAFEAVVADAIPLVELLWRSEEAATPLNTPERRAGLNQRLQNLAEMLSDQVIRSQYRSDFRERFFQNYGWKKHNRDQFIRFANQVRETAVDKDLIERVEISLNRSILFGLMRWPEVIYNKRERINQLQMPNPYLSQWRDHIIDASYEEPDLRQDCIQQILDSSDLDPKVKFSILTDLKFGFLSVDMEPYDAVTMLESCIDAMFEEQQADRELAIFQSIHLASDVRSEFDEAKWHSLRAIQDIKRSAHARVQRFAEAVESQMLAA